MQSPDFIQEEIFKVVIWRKTMSANLFKPPVELLVKPPVSEHVKILLALLVQKGPLSNNEIRMALKLKDRRRLRETYIMPALGNSLIEYTISEKPNCRLQKYKITDLGREVWA